MSTTPDPMILTQYVPDTYGCPNCPYQQNQDPLSAAQQSPDWFPNVPLGMCPACYLSGKGSYQMGKLLTSDITVVHNIASDQAIDQIAQQEQLDSTQTQALIDERNQNQDTLASTAVATNPAPTLV